MNKTDTKSTVLLKHHLKALKLPVMHAECEKIAHRCPAASFRVLEFETFFFLGTRNAESER
jgi:hypothetical protein